MDFIWCPICGGEFEETGEKVACTICKYMVLPADPSVGIEPEEAKRMIEESKAQLIDVRTIYERMNGQIPGSVLISINELRGKISEINKAKPVIVYCQHGIRSFHAAQFLRQNGFNARSLKGGLEAWNGE